jgi:hypothetical protein
LKQSIDRVNRICKIQEIVQEYFNRKNNKSKNINDEIFVYILKLSELKAEVKWILPL